MLGTFTVLPYAAPSLKFSPCEGELPLWQLVHEALKTWLCTSDNVAEWIVPPLKTTSAASMMYVGRLNIRNGSFRIRMNLR